MAIKSHTTHVRLSGPVLPVEIRRWVGMLGPDVIPLGDHKQRNETGLFDVGRPPVGFLRQIYLVLIYYNGSIVLIRV